MLNNAILRCGRENSKVKFKKHARHKKLMFLKLQYINISFRNRYLGKYLK